ncbi:MAG TPA: hypothetical protein VIP77_24445 [Jiangellaceae bacterium]
MRYDTITHTIEHALEPVEVMLDAGPSEFWARAVATRHWRGRPQILLSQGGRLVWVDAHRVHLVEPEAVGLEATTAAGTPSPTLG